MIGLWNLTLPNSLFLSCFEISIFGLPVVKLKQFVNGLTYPSAVVLMVVEVYRGDTGNRKIILTLYKLMKTLRCLCRI